MIALSSLSRIGFGTYRWNASERQVEALRLALGLGCNLIDTAPTYGTRQSRAALGRVLAEHGSSVFVITKAGYLHPAEQVPAAVTLPDGRSRYSIHPQVLRARIDQSCVLLRRPTLDGFLLHNPEHLLDEVGVAGYTEQVSAAFAHCEEQVRLGRIRYYGISSNTLPLPDHALGRWQLALCLDIAAKLSRHHHFRLLQFPFNLAETAAAHSDNGEPSLLQAAADGGLVAMSNRPLNLKTGQGPVRLVDQPGGIDHPSTPILQRLTAASSDRDSRALLASVSENWAAVSTPDALDYVFSELLEPLLAGASVGQLQLFAELRDAKASEIRRALATAAADVVRAAAADGLLHGPDHEPIARRACRAYLEAGVDHVLVGMRHSDHVRSVSALF